MTKRRTRVLSLASAVFVLLAACNSGPAATDSATPTDAAVRSSGSRLPRVPTEPLQRSRPQQPTSWSSSVQASRESTSPRGSGLSCPRPQEAPPGTITFRFQNQGTVPHALRIRTPGSGGDRLEWHAEAVGPGESGLLVADLAPGTYEIDCPVEDGHGEHDAARHGVPLHSPRWRSRAGSAARHRRCTVGTRRLGHRGRDRRLRVRTH